MKKLIYTIAFVVMGITASYAQKSGKDNGKPKGTAEQRAEKVASSMQEKLSLTADQKEKVQQIELARIKKNDEWRALDEETMKGKMEERKSFNKATKDKLDAILTTEQRKTLEDAKNEMKAKSKDNKGDKESKGKKGKKGEQSPPPPTTKNN